MIVVVVGCSMETKLPNFPRDFLKDFSLFSCCEYFFFYENPVLFVLLEKGEFEVEVGWTSMAALRGEVSIFWSWRVFFLTLSVSPLLSLLFIKIKKPFFPSFNRFSIGRFVLLLSTWTWLENTDFKETFSFILCRFLGVMPISLPLCLSLLQARSFIYNYYFFKLVWTLPF